MRGTVLLLDSTRSLQAAADIFRGAGLVVHHCEDAAEALNQFDRGGADVVVLASPAVQSIVGAFRDRADHATTILVTSRLEQRDVARDAGADAFLPSSAPPADLLYEIHRALILRRSGRRLPWNG